MAETITKTFDLSLVTPEGAAFEGEANMVVVPGAAGEIGVLPRHAPLVAMMKAGETRIKTGDQWTTWATGPGYFKIQRVLSQPLFVAEVFTGTPGKLVDLKDTISSFKAICAGEYDDLPEASFYMVGPIEEAVEKAKQMAAEAA